MEELAEFSWIAPLVAAPFVGSFLGVLVERLPAGAGVVGGRSACPACGETLAVRDLIPIAGWLVNRGKCRSCAAPVSPFHPAIEGGALVIAAWAAVFFSGWLLWASCALGWTLLALAFMDQRHFMLSDKLTLPLIGAGLVVSLGIGNGAVINHAIGAVIGFTAFAALAWLYRRLRGREGLGLGDAKLLAAAGAWVSWHGLPSVILWGSVVALAVAAGRAAAKRPLAADQPIAFGPYLALGIWFVWLYGPITISLP